MKIKTDSLFTLFSGAFIILLVMLLGYFFFHYMIFQTESDSDNLIAMQTAETEVVAFISGKPMSELQTEEFPPNMDVNILTPKSILITYHHSYGNVKIKVVEDKEGNLRYFVNPKK